MVRANHGFRHKHHLALCARAGQAATASDSRRADLAAAAARLPLLHRCLDGLVHVVNLLLIFFLQLRALHLERGRQQLVVGRPWLHVQVHRLDHLETLRSRGRDAAMHGQQRLRAWSHWHKFAECELTFGECER